MNIRIVADSACDLPKSLVEEMNIDIMPVPITDGTTNYKDGIDITPDVMYKNMKEGIIYKTSQIPLADYIEKYTYYAENNIPMLSIVMSSGISSSSKTSQMAINIVKELYPNAPIYSVDSKCCSLGHGFAAYMLAKSANSGHNIDTLLELLHFIQNNMVSTASLDDLKYVARGGRLPNVVAMIANTLNIKPFLNADDGSLHLSDRVRGVKKMYKKYIEILKDRIETTDLKNSQIWLEKSDDEEMMLTLRDAIKEDLGLTDDNFVLGTIGPIIGAHIGPGSMCMFFLTNPIPDMYF